MGKETWLRYHAVAFLPIEFRQSFEAAGAKAQGDHAERQVVAVYGVALPVVLRFAISHSAISIHALAFDRLYPIALRR